jgi:predicted aspartyl protease
MLQGTIDTVGQVYIPIELIMADGGRSMFAALLDTGFTGSIGIREELLPALGWQQHGYVEADLASGTESLPVFIGQVIFDGRHRVVRAIVITSDDVILGLALLRDKRLLADFRTATLPLSEGGQCRGNVDMHEIARRTHRMERMRGRKWRVVEGRAW